MKRIPGQLPFLIFSHPKGDYFCPCYGVFMLPLSLHDYESIRTDVSADVEVQCPSCGYKLDPTTDQTKHASKLTPKITEEMIADEKDEIAFLRLQKKIQAESKTMRKQTTLQKMINEMRKV